MRNENHFFLDLGKDVLSALALILFLSALCLCVYGLNAADMKPV